MAEEKSNTSRVGSSAFFTKDQLTKAREAGYSEEEIALHISKGSNEIKNAMEEGYSLDEIADYFAVDPIASKEEAVNADIKSPSLSDVGKGLIVDIALAEGMKSGRNCWWSRARCIRRSGCSNHCSCGCCYWICKRGVNWRSPWFCCRTKN